MGWVTLEDDHGRPYHVFIADRKGRKGSTAARPHAAPSEPVPGARPSGDAVRRQAAANIAARRAARAAAGPLHEQAARAAAAVPLERRVGADKVWLHHAHEEYLKQGGALPLDLFKKRLVETPEGRMQLSRADLVQAFDPADVRASQANYTIGGQVAAEYNFIRARGGPPPAPGPGPEGKPEAAPQPPAREPSAIGAPRPGEKFSLLQRSATASRPAAVDTGRGTTKFMFDMNRRDLPGQTSLLDKVGTVPAPAPAPGSDMVKAAAAATKAAREKTAAAVAEMRRVADVQAHPEIHAKPGDVVQIGVGHVAFDPERFQYKLNATGARGVSSELHQVKNWNPESAGIISVWRDPANGQTYVVNGHHRLDLANRLGVEKVTARYIEAADAKTARMKGAITNIAEGRGTPIDAAKFFREAGISKERMHDYGIPMTESTAKHGLAMAGLEDSLFRKVVNQELPVERASIIGGSGLSHAEQLSVHAMAAKSVNNDTLRELVANAKAAPTIRTTSRSLFGDTVEEKNLALQRAKVQASVAKTLSGDKKLFGLVSKSKAAQSLEERGRSHIDTEETGRVSSEAAQVLGVFHTLKNRSGPVAAELNRAAERLHAGESEAAVMKEARAKVTEHVRRMLKGGAEAFAA